jgi:lactate dehydrogenase-like 2-hydroxyacid dehydrogenase
VKGVEVLVVGRLPARTVETLVATFTAHRAADNAAIDALVQLVAPRIRAIATGFGVPLGEAIFARLPKLEIVASFGVGYDGIDAKAAAARGVIVTNTPDVLTEEVADTAIGLLIMTVRELSAAERHLRSGAWAAGRGYPVTPLTMRDRTAGILGLGRIGMAIARRLDAMLVPVAYHGRRPRPGVPYRYYDDLRAMAADVDTLIVVVPGGANTRHMVDAAVLRALGPRGVLINIGRGSTVDERALIAALKDHTIAAAGLDVFEDEPHVPAELTALANAVLLPHVASASVHTRNAMGDLVVDNLRAWFGEGRPLTPVAETPWPEISRGSGLVSGPGKSR